jgi:3-oxoacyl-[acyl-carrier protein] reductase
MDRRVALITGGIRGIGRAVALSLAQEGWAIAATYRTSREDAERMERDVCARGTRAVAIQADVSDAAIAQELVRNVESEFGRIDALVNCAGPFRRVHLLEESLEGWHSMFDNNLHPVFYLSRAVAEGMKRRHWGRIVNFSIVNADQLAAQPFITAHYIAKVGVLVLTRALARALAPDGITVNSISPGFIETQSGAWDDLTEAVRRIPAGYIGKPEDAAAAVKFLLSDGARYVNGANIRVSGAWGI